MAGHAVIVPDWANNRLPYSHAVRAGDTLYITGLVGQAENGEIPDSLPEQMRIVLTSLDKVLQAAGAGRADIVMNTVYLKNEGDFKSMNRLYRDFFASDTSCFPARCTVRADMMDPRLLIEITSIAHIAA